MNMTNVYNIPAREKMLMSMVKRIASSVRNAFRQDVSSQENLVKNCYILNCFF